MTTLSTDQMVSTASMLRNLKKHTPSFKFSTSADEEKTETNTGDAVIVHNTFSCNWEMKPYKDMAKEFGWSVFVIECQNDFGSTHECTR